MTHLVHIQSHENSSPRHLGHIEIKHVVNLEITLIILICITEVYISSFIFHRGHRVTFYRVFGDVGPAETLPSLKVTLPNFFDLNSFKIMLMVKCLVISEWCLSQPLCPPIICFCTITWERGQDRSVTYMFTSTYNFAAHPTFLIHWVLFAAL